MVGFDNRQALISTVDGGGGASRRRAVLFALIPALALAASVSGSAQVATRAQKPPKDRATHRDIQAARRGAVTTPPPLVATPWADEFVITGSEEDLGDHYLPANGDGTVGTLTNIPGLPIVDGIDVADVDSDGDLDFLTAEGTSGNVYLYTNRGNGAFAPARVASGISTAFSTNLRIADFNADGRPDFVVGDARTALGLKVFLQNGAGRFRRTADLDLTWNDAPGPGETGPTMMGIATGDIDRDGTADVAVLAYEGEAAGEVRLYKGNGHGRFSPPARLFDIEDTFGVNLFATGLAAFDFDGDGDLDLVTGDAAGRIAVYTNDGAGAFKAPADAAFSVEGQSGIDAYDADHDGDDDLVIVVGASRRLYSVENLEGLLAPPFVAATLDGFTIGVGAPPLPAPSR